MTEMNVYVYCKYNIYKNIFKVNITMYLQILAGK